MIGRLEYCGAGQIRDAKTKRLVSPREIVKAWHESSAVNVAAMRKALRWIIDWSDVLFRYRNDPATIEAYSGKIFNMAQSAFAEPVRNCDLYANAADALKAHEKAFDEDNFENGECKLGCPGCDEFPIDCKILWLFAQATEGASK